ncbi:MAG: DUF433 domain-containing protein [Bryobacteraceae bacterium]
MSLQNVSHQIRLRRVSTDDQNPALHLRAAETPRSQYQDCKIEVMSVDLVAARVTANPQVRSGQPIIRGTRITVWDILGWLAGGLTESAILSDYPELRPEDIQAAFQFAYQLKDKVT